MLTITDFILILQKYYREANVRSLTKFENIIFLTFEKLIYGFY